MEDREVTLLTEQADLQARITSNYPEYAALRYPQPVALDTLQQQVLQPGELMLIYGVMHDKTCLWVIGPEVFGLYTLDVGEEELAEQVEAFRDALQAAWEPDRALFVVTSAQDQRFAKIKHVFCNAHMTTKQIRTICQLDDDCHAFFLARIYGF